MPVSTLPSVIAFSTNGTQQDFTFPYYVVKNTDISIYNYINAGNIFHYALGTDFTITTTPDGYGAFPYGLIVHFGTAPASSGTLAIIRKTQLTQLTQYVNNDPFPADTINHALDKLALAIQDMSPTFNDTAFKGALFAPPTTGQHYQGSWYKNLLPVVGGYYGWICTASGTPGTWHPFGLIVT